MSKLLLASVFVSPLAVRASNSQAEENLRESGGKVFNDIPGDGFNLDHVAISTREIYAIETKTWTKPSPQARVVVEGEDLRVAGQVPDRDPIAQVSAAARWLEGLLLLSTDKRFLVRGVVVFRAGLPNNAGLEAMYGSWSRRRYPDSLESTEDDCGSQRGVDCFSLVAVYPE
jgi:hypothetical protein